MGTRVTWTNRDDIPYNVVTEDKTIKSKLLDTDGEVFHDLRQTWDIFLLLFHSSYDERHRRDAVGGGPS